MKKTKKCRRCNKRKTLEQFRPKRNECKQCNTEIHAIWVENNREKVEAYAKERYRAHREESIAAVKKWRAENPERVQKTAAAWYAKNSHKSKATARRSKLRKAYGLTEEVYGTLLLKQNGGCAVCGKPPNGIRLAVDHDHSTGEVRGLLCSKHNTAIGLCADSVDELRACASYLEQYFRRLKLCP